MPSLTSRTRRRAATVLASGLATLSLTIGVASAGTAVNAKAPHGQSARTHHTATDARNHLSGPKRTTDRKI
jgi:hypothetical protein